MNVRDEAKKKLSRNGGMTCGCYTPELYSIASAHQNRSSVIEMGVEIGLWNIDFGG